MVSFRIKTHQAHALNTPFAIVAVPTTFVPTWTPAYGPQQFTAHASLAPTWDL